jgi:hypothetical protein
MKATVRSATLAVAAGLTLAACAGGRVSPTQVTRFHLGQPIAPATVAIEPRPGVDGTGPEFRTYEAVIAAELSRLGFRPAERIAGSEAVAVVDVARGTRERPARSGLSIGLGGGSFSGGRHGGTSVGGGVSFPVGRRTDEVVGTLLSVQLKRRSDGSIIWEGRAQGEARADTPEAQPAEAVRRLAAALFQGFPGESGRTITVK